MVPITLHISSNGTHNSADNLKTDTHNSSFFGKKVTLNNGTSPLVKPIKLTPPPPRCEGNKSQFFYAPGK